MTDTDVISTLICKHIAVGANILDKNEWQSHDLCF